MTNLFYSNFDTVFDSMLNWDNDSRSISTPTSYIKDDVLKIELEVPGLSNKDIDVKVEDRFLLMKAEKDNRKLERKYKIHESFYGFLIIDLVNQFLQNHLDSEHLNF